MQLTLRDWLLGILSLCRYSGNLRRNNLLLWSIPVDNAVIIGLVVIVLMNYFGLPLEKWHFYWVMVLKTSPNINYHNYTDTIIDLSSGCVHEFIFNLRFAYESVFLTRSPLLPWHLFTWLLRFLFGVLPRALITALQHVQNMMPDFLLVQETEHIFHIPCTSFIPLIDFLGNSVLILSSYFNAFLLFFFLIFLSS